MAILEIAKIQVRRGQENQTGIPQLAPGEFGWAEDTEHLYIGKRISEGATNDSNSRILTENDKSDIIDQLGGIFSTFRPHSQDATTSSYKYRDGISFIHSSISTVAVKSDNSVNLTDYDVRVSSTATDITTKFRLAVNDLFKNSNWSDLARRDARRKLIVPAGNYLINDVIDLPPYTSIEGEGQELTTLTLLSTITNMFRTVDAEGHTYEIGMSGGVKRSRQVTIKGMTLQYSTSTNNTKSPSLISIDNVLNTIIEDVSFRTAIDTTSTTTYGLVSSGIGISIRGTGGGIESGDTNLCENIQIHRCKFDSLYIGVEGTGTVVRPVITDNVFSNLDRGVSLYAADQHLGPTNGLISSNRFKSIVREAIFVGTSTNKTMHISENNYFVQVGNGRELDDHTTINSTATSIITFYSEGNKTINDYFHRRTVANSTTTSASFYYWPLLTGKAIIDDTAVFTATIGTYTSVTHGIQNLMKIGLTDYDQMVTIRYQLTNTVLSRKGNILLNIGSSSTSTEAFASLTDTYNFSASDLVIEEFISTSTGVLHSPTQFVVDLDMHNIFRDVIGVSEPYPGQPVEIDGTWFIVDTANNNNAAQITYFNTSSANIAVFDTQSAPVMTFDNLNQYTLARAVSSPIVLDMNTTLSTATNYVTLTARNDSTSTATISNIEFNINILQ
jgi:hypothetical protein